MLLNEVVDELGTGTDFVGHVGGDDFLITTAPAVAAKIQARLIQRFGDEVLTFYSFKDRERGHVEVVDGQGQVRRAPLMTCAVGLIHDTTADFADIREITEVAAEARRQSR